MESAAGRLAHGQIIQLGRAGGSGVVGSLLGAGGQGAVYAVDVGGRSLALKWYHPHVVRQDLTLRERIARLVAMGAPDKRFLWPMAMAEIGGREEFGYVMALSSPDRRPLNDIIAAPPRRLELPLEARAMAGFAIADSLQQLHAKGLCYQDVNFGGFFVDPLRGDVMICDTDNISVEGAVGGVYGTRKFMAPEIVRWQATPSTKTDLYSMAVLFFYLLFGWHPLDGAREAAIATIDPAAERSLYGDNPLFLFDSRDRSNGPVARAHDWIVARWRAMPDFVRGLFARSFEAGLADPNARVVETEWRRMFTRLGDAVARCPSCKFEIPFAGADQAPTCAACGHEVPRPARMALSRDLVGLQSGRELYQHHIDAAAPIRFAEPVARIAQHPVQPAILGIHNLTGATWQGRLRDNKPVLVMPGRSLRIVDGLEVDFGPRSGLVADADVTTGAAE